MLIRPPSLIVAVVLAATGGLLIRTAFPAPAVWPLAFLGLVLVLIALRGRGFFSGILVGLVAGATLWGSLIFWLTLYLGPIPWLALCGLMSLWVGLSGGLIAMVYRWGEGLGSWMWFGATPMAAPIIAPEPATIPSALFDRYENSSAPLCVAAASATPSPLTSPCSASTRSGSAPDWPPSATPPCPCPAPTTSWWWSIS